GKRDAVKALVDHGAKVNATEDLRGTNALMWAAEQGHSAIVEFLLDNGTDLNAQSKVIRPIRRNGLGFGRPGSDGKPNGDPMGARLSGSLESQCANDGRAGAEHGRRSGFHQAASGPYSGPKHADRGPGGSASGEYVAMVEGGRRDTAAASGPLRRSHRCAPSAGSWRRSTHPDIR